ncbi:proteasome subunit beta [Pseudomonas typographi]|uniref:proteasome subunit beta n=1 Tax=Pseudomonas typographi TaxID=2715964 RepID=UPI001689D951|nr:proteasome subunit beta [Pseudomonas typographi]MBD1589772.1 proteasome subunit beta [Pseudomonas typographi]
MTTIAYKDGVIAYDSRISDGSFIIHDDYDKRHEVKGVQFVLSGKVCDYPKLIDAWFGGPVTVELECAALAYDGESLWYVGASPQHGLCKTPIWAERPYVMGSGGDHAITAMDMGATAAEAVEMAKKRDTSTGGKVRTLIVLPGVHSETAKMAAR